jgi:hypothetical protein
VISRSRLISVFSDVILKLDLKQWFNTSLPFSCIVEGQSSILLMMLSRVPHRSAGKKEASTTLDELQPGARADSNQKEFRSPCCACESNGYGSMVGRRGKAGSRHPDPPSAA